MAKATNKLDKIDYAIKKIRLSSDVTWRPRLRQDVAGGQNPRFIRPPHIVRYYQAWLEAGSGDAGLVHQSSNASLTSAVPQPSSTTPGLDPGRGGRTVYTIIKVLRHVRVGHAVHAEAE